jgi:uncharacterized protein (DUF433 family)
MVRYPEFSDEPLRGRASNEYPMEGIVRTEDILGGEPRLAGRRIAVRQIAELAIDGGVQPAEVADQLEIELADVHRALTYYYDHPEEMATVRKRHREAMDRVREEALDPPKTATK